MEHADAAVVVAEDDRAHVLAGVALDAAVEEVRGLGVDRLRHAEAVAREVGDVDQLLDHLAAGEFPLAPPRRVERVAVEAAGKVPDAAVVERVPAPDRLAVAVHEAAGGDDVRQLPTIDSARARSSAIGFSTSRLTPAAAAASTCPLWAKGGRATISRSSCGFAEHAREIGVGASSPKRPANASVLAWIAAAAATSVSPAACAAAAWRAAMPPVPRMPYPHGASPKAQDRLQDLRIAGVEPREQRRRLVERHRVR